jgi:TonB family protein
MLGEAQKLGAWDETPEDLRTLVDGFLELSRATGSQASPVIAISSALSTPSQPAVAGPVSSPVAPVAFGVEDTGVVAPVVVSQTAPHVPPELLELVRTPHRTGRIDVVIDEHGDVEDVIVRQSVNSSYDARVAAAARTWKYRPAMKDGVPVRYAKAVVINAQ